jgi:hypothetical protein
MVWLEGTCSRLSDSSRDMIDVLFLELVSVACCLRLFVVMPGGEFRNKCFSLHRTLLHGVAIC